MPQAPMAQGLLELLSLPQALMAQGLLAREPPQAPMAQGSEGQRRQGRQPPPMAREPERVLPELVLRAPGQAPA